MIGYVVLYVLSQSMPLMLCNQVTLAFRKASTGYGFPLAEKRFVLASLDIIVSSFFLPLYLLFVLIVDLITLSHHNIVN